jgi:hypothetical protein
LLFLQEIISEQDLVFGGNPRLPRVRPEGEQREYSLFPLFFPCFAAQHYRNGTAAEKLAGRREGF